MMPVPAALSSMGAVETALVARLLADATLSALLSGEKVYSRVAPQTLTVDGEDVPTPVPFLVVGDRVEDPMQTFDRTLTDGLTRLHLWSGKIGNAEVSLLYGHVFRLLHREPLMIPGGGVVRGWLRHSFDTVDEGGQRMHSIEEFRWLRIV